MSTTATEGLDQWTGKKVIVTRNLSTPDADGNLAVEVEGLVQAGNAMGLLVKPKGKVNFELIEASEIEDVRLAPEKAKELKPTKLKPITIDKIKRHLADRHGVGLDWLNSVTDEDAVKYHDGIDHAGLKLGHVHVTESEAEATPAVNEAAPEGDDASEGDEA